MPYCNDQSFYKHFKQNMNALGLPAPDTLFGTLGTAVATASTILRSIDALGKTATIADILGATTKLEALGIVSALAASFYAGAVVGSIAVASGKYLSCGTTISDALTFSQRNGIHRPWLRPVFIRYPGIIDQQVLRRAHYYQRMAVA